MGNTNIQKNARSFLEKARLIHGEKFDYSRVEYKNIRIPVLIICPDHGEFSQCPRDHLQSEHCCPGCAGKSRGMKRRRTLEYFIQKAREIHREKYDYSQTVYVKDDVPILIGCPTHGIFSQMPRCHLAGSGCVDCGLAQSNQSKRREIFGDIPHFYWVTIKHNAKQRNIPFQLTPEEAWNKYCEQNGKCALSGVPIGFRDERIDRHTASLDRIDSNGIYELSNVQWVHKTINRMKSDIDEHEFLAFCTLVVEHLEKRYPN